jgi:hypothetical protein
MKPNVIPNKGLSGSARSGHRGDASGGGTGDDPENAK